jgi:hypothetical protein
VDIEGWLDFMLSFSKIMKVEEIELAASLKVWRNCGVYCKPQYVYMYIDLHSLTVRTVFSPYIS